jgi:hypothetical protein
MSKGSRNYKAEYARRIANALARGLSRSQARGHAQAGEAASGKVTLPLPDDRLQIALQALRKDGSLSKAAKSAKVSPERFRRYAVERGAIEKSKGRWKIRRELPRQMALFSRGKLITVTVGDFEAASRVGKYMAAVRNFLDTNNQSFLTPFLDQSVRDIRNKDHPFEIRPNILYRLASGGEHTFEQIYRIVI